MVGRPRGDHPGRGRRAQLRLGAAIVANSATQSCCARPPRPDVVSHAFRLSEGETALVASAGQGLGLLAAGQARVAFQVIASPAEHPGLIQPRRTRRHQRRGGRLLHRARRRSRPPWPRTRPHQSAVFTLVDDPEGELRNAATCRYIAGAREPGRQPPVRLPDRSRHDPVPARTHGGSPCAGRRTRAALALTALTTTVVRLRSLLRARRHATYTDGARVITVLAPPKVDPRGAEALWSHLMGLLRPARARLLTGQPHLAFEYCWSSSGVRVRFWVPGTVPPHMIERAIVSAWPGSHTDTLPPRPTPFRCRRPRWPPGACGSAARFRPSAPTMALTRCARCWGLQPALPPTSTRRQVLARPVTGRRALFALRHQGEVLRGGSASCRPPRVRPAGRVHPRRTARGIRSGPGRAPRAWSPRRPPTTGRLRQSGQRTVGRAPVLRRRHHDGEGGKARQPAAAR